MNSLRKWIFGLLVLVIFSCGKEESENIPAYGSAILEVTNDYNDKLAGVSIILEKKNPSGKELVSEMKTNSSGEIQYKNLAPGDYILTGNDQKLTTIPVSFSVKAGEESRLSVIMTEPFARLKILNYNVLQGFQNDAVQKDKFISWVKAKDPDIICFQELNNFKGDSFQEFAYRFNHPYTVLLKENSYPTGISSKYPILDVKRVVSGFINGYVYARIKDVQVFSLHLSPTTIDTRLREIDLIKRHLDSLSPDAKILLAGDFNSYSRLDQDAYGPAFEKDMIARNPNTPVNFTVTNTLMDAGYKDTYYMFHSEYKRSVPTAKYLKTGDRGCRYDYIFLSDNLSKDCISGDIIHDSVTDVLSDHYPVWIELQNAGKP